MDKTHTITVFSENRPGVLHRITVVLTKRRINIESLTVSETEIKGISRFTIVVRTDESLIPIVVKQINRIIEVREVFANEDEELVYREIALIRVSTASSEERREVEEVANRYKAWVAYAEADAMIIQTAGTEDSVRSLYQLLEPFGIEEFIRSGRIALTKVHRDRSDHKVAAYS
jgi:acetolactate synthase-1/3 small subunit